MSLSSAPSLSLVKETAIERGESDHMIFTVEEFENFERQFKRRLAAEADTDEVTGRSTMLEMKSYFCRQTTLGQYDE